MALPLRAGDPLPRLPGRDTTLRAAALVGRWTLLAVTGTDTRATGGPREDDDSTAGLHGPWLAAHAAAVVGVHIADAAEAAARPGWQLHIDAGRCCTQRLGALAEDGAVEAVVTVVDPRGVVAVTFTGGAFGGLVDAAVAYVQARI